MAGADSPEVLGYKVRENERDLRELSREVNELRVQQARSQSEQDSMQRSIDALTATVNKLMWAILGTGLTVAGALIAFALTGGGG